MECAFCTDRARITYEDLPFCRWHWMWLYMSRNLTWSD
jgi:hypothetical protein